LWYRLRRRIAMARYTFNMHLSPRRSD
jgi:hypothetical protein